MTGAAPFAIMRFSQRGNLMSNKPLSFWCAAISIWCAVLTWAVLSGPPTPDRGGVEAADDNVETVVSDGAVHELVVADIGNFEQIQSKRIYLATGTKGAILVEMTDNGPQLVLGSGRARISIRISDGLPSIHVRGPQGHTATLGCADPAQPDAEAHRKRPASSLYLQDNIGRIVWRSPSSGN
jgi:hypothetical protein